MTVTPAGPCPFDQIDQNRDERKSAALAAANMSIAPGSEVIDSFAFAREILRSPKVKQAGAGAELIDVGNPEHVPVFFLDGEPHKRRRVAITKFFTPKTIQTRYRSVMERTTDELLERLKLAGSAQLDDISFELAVTVAADIVGLTHDKPRNMAPRIAAFLDVTFAPADGFRKYTKRLREIWHAMHFFRKDVGPAVRERRARPREDVITQVIDKGYSDKAIMIECLTYATAGMVTTREFIVMVAWYLFERPELRERFLSSDEQGQLAILSEILRLEPVAGQIYRRVDEDLDSSLKGTVPAGRNYTVDMRAVNSDESVVGPCPHMLDPDRAQKQNQNGTFMSFGDGAHHCPGWQVALHETRVFIDRLMRVPGIRLDRVPDMHWNSQLMSYELRNAIVSCDKNS